MIQFTHVKTDREISIAADLAKTIWTEYFTPMIGEKQVSYMLEKMQSFGAMKQQVTDGYHYFLIQNKIESIGYICVKPGDNGLFLSKLYLLNQERGKGTGRQALGFIEKKAREFGKRKIWLTVNKGNHGTIEAYKKWGFKIVDSPVTDIGGGFVMDDYKMEKAV
ncbi:MAG: GNAT family N-acetyltransferase [Bacteroidota bacterium]